MLVSSSSSSSSPSPSPSPRLAAQASDSDADDSRDSKQRAQGTKRFKSLHATDVASAQHAVQPTAAPAGAASSMPLTFKRTKQARTCLVFELDAPDLALDGDSGVVGRLTVGAGAEVALDLKGMLYHGTAQPCTSLLWVAMGPTSAQIEAASDCFVALAAGMDTTANERLVSGAYDDTDAEMGFRAPLAEGAGAEDDADDSSSSAAVRAKAKSAKAGGAKAGGGSGRARASGAAGAARANVAKAGGDRGAKTGGAKAGGTKAGGAKTGGAKAGGAKAGAAKAARAKVEAASTPGGAGRKSTAARKSKASASDASEHSAEVPAAKKTTVAKPATRKKAPARRRDDSDETDSPFSGDSSDASY